MFMGWKSSPIEFFSQETFQILGNEALIIAGYKDINISIIHLLAVKTLIFIQLHSFKSANIPQNSAFFEP